MFSVKVHLFNVFGRHAPGLTLCSAVTLSFLKQESLQDGGLCGFLVMTSCCNKQELTCFTVNNINFNSKWIKVCAVI